MNLRHKSKAVFERGGQAILQPLLAAVMIMVVTMVCFYVVDKCKQVKRKKDPSAQWTDTIAKIKMEPEALLSRIEQPALDKLRGFRAEIYGSDGQCGEFFLEIGMKGLIRGDMKCESGFGDFKEYEVEDFEDSMYGFVNSFRKYRGKEKKGESQLFFITQVAINGGDMGLIFGPLFDQMEDNPFFKPNKQVKKQKGKDGYYLPRCFVTGWLDHDYNITGEVHCVLVKSKIENGRIKIEEVGRKKYTWVVKEKW